MSTNLYQRFQSALRYFWKKDVSLGIFVKKTVKFKLSHAIAIFIQGYESKLLIDAINITYYIKKCYRFR